MEKTWLKQYTEGVPHELDLDPAESLVDIFTNACNYHGGQIAYSSLGQSLTYRELDDLTARFATWLQTEAGLSRGDRVAIMMPNLLQYPVALFGILRAGMIIVNVNPLYTPRELEFQLIDSGARAIVLASMSAATLAEVINETSVEQVIVTDVGDLFSFPQRLMVNFILRHIKKMVPRYDINNAVSLRSVLATSPAGLRPEQLSGADLAVLQYTGGTTGRAKGAMLSHGNLVANVRQLNSWFAEGIEIGKELIVTALPLYHVYALMCNCLCYLSHGGHNLLIIDPRDTSAFIREMKKYPFTAITGVNTLYQSLINHPDLATVDFSSLKVVSAGGMAVLDDTARQWSAITRTVITEGYGLSETSPVITSNPYGLKEFTGSIGLPLPNTEISLRDDNNCEVPVGESGELCVRGPQVMSGYWNNPDATAQVMTEDGFFRTGDIAIVDEQGYFTIVDRKKDMIIVSGFNVYPNEIENVLTMHPDIIEAACVGVRDDRGREVVKAFLAVKPGAATDAAQMREFCRENLTAYKVPAIIEFRTEMPKSAVGKILRRELRDNES
ncbi:MAG: AMP-binding protein [Gammaproteobacteria bacterium]|jgi:long-chain acyl-CoA synthetase|nr:AMP-binding protein [Gammaproteobacteria bacterium]MDP7296607.1 AMP-binding protein [Gammaproteobacteria bacterium]MDP7419343.1 AMP-binding protein [Gammaproteobacteria bacterium]MDP7659609.1 AMP-binding protein [Gammaproteobacteria bacterium]HJP37675.1 AMP-binding protein [Gammaproteobacteria bacterium]